MSGDFLLQPAEKQIFGWPSDEAGGGVWWYGISKFRSRRSEEDWDFGTQAGLEAAIEIMEESVREQETMVPFEVKLRKQEDINGVCDVLREARAVYYKDVRECPEAVGLGLLEYQTGRMT